MSKILVLDDEELMTETIRKLLSKRGYSVEIFSNPMLSLNVMQRRNLILYSRTSKCPISMDLR